MNTTSKIDVWNMALARMGGAYVKQVDSAFEPTREAQMCELFYPHVLKSLLSAHPFGFARRLAPLALKKTAGSSILPEGGLWTAGLPVYEYAYPQDALKVWDVGPGMDLSHCNFTGQYKVLSNQAGEKVIHCCQAQAHALYSYMELDTSRYSPMFVEAVLLALAQKLCPALSNEQNLAQALGKEASIALDAAITDDANQAYRRAPVSEYIAAGISGCYHGG